MFFLNQPCNEPSRLLDSAAQFKQVPRNNTASGAVGNSCQCDDGEDKDVVPLKTPHLQSFTEEPPLEVASSSPLFTREQLKQVAQEHVLMGSEHLPG